jgi:hypothetical protein
MEATATTINPVTMESPLIRKLKSMNVDFRFGSLIASTDHMVAMFNEDAGGPGTYVTTVSLALGGEKTLATEVTKSVRAPIHTTLGAKAGAFGSKRAVYTGGVTFAPILEAATHTAADTRTYVIEKCVPVWADLPDQTVTIYTNKPIRKISDIRRPGMLAWVCATPTDGTDCTRMRVKIAKKPFSEGATRLATYCHIEFTAGWQLWVAKEFKGTAGDKSVHTIDQYLKQIEVSTIAAFLADLFNTSASKPEGCLHQVARHIDQRQASMELLPREAPEWHIHKVLQQHWVLERGCLGRTKDAGTLCGMDV